MFAFKSETSCGIGRNLERMKCVLQIFFAADWHLFWPKMKKNYPRLKERVVKAWLEELWQLLEKKVDIHAGMANKLQLDEIQHTQTCLEQRFEVLNINKMQALASKMQL